MNYRSAVDSVGTSYQRWGAARNGDLAATEALKPFDLALADGVLVRRRER
jgi:hypothetical protein